MSDDRPTYTRTVQFLTEELTASKAGQINRAMKDYRRARALACEHFREHGTDGFTLSDRNDLMRSIRNREDINLLSQSVYPSIITAKQNYEEYEKDPKASPPRANRADTLPLPSQQTRVFHTGGRYYLTVRTGTSPVSVPLRVSGDDHHAGVLPCGDALPIKKSSHQHIPGITLEEIEPGDFPENTVKLSTSTLSKVGERRYQANLVFQLEKPVVQNVNPGEARYVVGVDRGRNHLAYAALYDREDDHVVDWWNRSGDEVAHYMDRFAERVQEFQEAGVWSEMEDARQRRFRYKKQLDYEVANRLIDLARQRFDCVIALEELSGMSGLGGYSTESRRFSEWSYYRLAECIKDKAEPYDIPVVEVDPAYTSQLCSRCGSDDTRRESVHFECRECDYEQNADANAAVNIAKAV